MVQGINLSRKDYFDDKMNDMDTKINAVNNKMNSVNNMYDELTQVNETQSELYSQLAQTDQQLEEDTQETTMYFLQNAEKIRTRKVLSVQGFFSVDDNFHGKYRVLSVTGSETWTDIKNNANVVIYQVSNNGEIRAKNNSKKLKPMKNSGSIDVKLLGAKGNANFFNSTDNKFYENAEFTILSTNDTQVLKSAMSLKLNLYIPDGMYLVDADALVWDRSYNITGAGELKSQLIAFGTGNILLDTDTNSAEDFAGTKKGVLREFTLDGRMLVDYGFYIRLGKNVETHDIRVQNFKTVPLQVGTPGGSVDTWALKFYNSTFIGCSSLYDLSQRPNYAVRFASTSTDNYMENCTFTNAKIAGLQDNGYNNRFHNSHSYGYPNAARFPYSFEANGGMGTWTSTIADTPTRSSFKFGGYGITVNNTTMLFTSAFPMTNDNYLATFDDVNYPNVYGVSMVNTKVIGDGQILRNFINYTNSWKKTWHIINTFGDVNFVKSLSLQNSWVVMDSGRAVPSVSLDNQGFVHIEGSMQGGASTGSTLLFNIPKGYRPEKFKYMQIMGKENTTNTFKPAFISISTGGNVTLLTSNVDEIILDGITPYKAAN